MLNNFLSVSHSIYPLIVAALLYLLIYLVEEQNEIDGETHKQSQETQVVEVTSQVVL